MTGQLANHGITLYACQPYGLPAFLLLLLASPLDDQVVTTAL